MHDHLALWAKLGGIDIIVGDEHHSVMVEKRPVVKDCAAVNSDFFQEWRNFMGKQTSGTSLPPSSSLQVCHSIPKVVSTTKYHILPNRLV
jgi:hypothetical protein